MEKEIKNWDDLSIEEKRKGFTSLTEDIDYIQVSGNCVSVINDLKSLSNSILKLELLHKDISIKINELHSVQTGKLYQPKQKLTKKQLKEKEERDFQEERRQIHLGWLN